MGIEIENNFYHFRRLHRYVELARALKHKNTSTFKHFTFLVNKTKVVSIGFNNILKPSRLLTYRLGGRHSEADSLENLDYSLIPSLTVVNIRLNPQGVLRNSYPCDVCLNFLLKMGFKRLYFSNDFGFGYEDLRLLKQKTKDYII